MSKDENKPNRDKGAYNSECEGFGHINVEFPTFLKKYKRGLSITWYDFYDESEEEIAITW